MMHYGSFYYTWITFGYIKHYHIIPTLYAFFYFTDIRKKTLLIYDFQSKDWINTYYMVKAF